MTEDTSGNAPFDEVALEETGHGGEGYGFGYFEAVDRDALSLLREDIGRQLGLASDRQNTLLQSAGILVAFASILLLQLLAMDPDLSGYGMLFTASMGAGLICCIAGILVILRSSGFALSTGMVAREAIDHYNRKETDGFEAKMVMGIGEAYETVYVNNTRLIGTIRYMVVLLLIGVLTMFTGWYL